MQDEAWEALVYDVAPPLPKAEMFSKVKVERTLRDHQRSLMGLWHLELDFNHGQYCLRHCKIVDVWLENLSFTISDFAYRKTKAQKLK